MAIKNNTNKINELIASINALPDASNGVDLPDLTSPASTSEVFSGKEYIDQNGTKRTGSFSIDSELSEQDSLITQLQSALVGKAVGSNSPYSSIAEFSWTPASDITQNSSWVNIPHPLGEKPDGFYMVSEEFTCDIENYQTVFVFTLDKMVYIEGEDCYLGILVAADKEYYLGIAVQAVQGNQIDSVLNSSTLYIRPTDYYGSYIIPAGKTYRILVYKR